MQSEHMQRLTDLAAALQRWEADHADVMQAARAAEAQMKAITDEMKEIVLTLGESVKMPEYGVEMRYTQPKPRVQWDDSALSLLINVLRIDNKDIADVLQSARTETAASAVVSVRRIG